MTAKQKCLGCEILFRPKEGKEYHSSGCRRSHQYTCEKPQIPSEVLDDLQRINEVSMLRYYLPEIKNGKYGSLVTSVRRKLRSWGLITLVYNGGVDGRYNEAKLTQKALDILAE